MIEELNHYLIESLISGACKIDCVNSEKLIYLIHQKKEFKKMARQKRNPAAHELIKQMMAMYQPETMEDVHDMLKDMFSDMLEEMLHLSARVISSMCFSDM